MAELKTQKNKASVAQFIAAVDDPQKRKDSKELLKIFKEVTKMSPAMWGGSIIGYGSYHYKSKRSKQEGDWMLTGFSPRKQALTIYIMSGFEKYEVLLRKLGKYKHSRGCLYVKRLEDIEVVVLKKLIKASVADMKKMYPS